MTTYNLTKNDTPKFISCSKKAPQKMARPVPVYMEVTPPGLMRKQYMHLGYSYEKCGLFQNLFQILVWAKMFLISS